MKLEIAILAGAESKQFLVDLAKITERLEKALAGGKAPQTTAALELDSDDSESEDFAPASTTKKSKAQKTRSFEDEEIEEELVPAKKTKSAAAASLPEEDEDDNEDFTTPKPKKKTEKKLTVDDVNDACKVRAQSIGGKEGRKQVLLILKKKFKTESVSELKPEQYAEAISAMQA